MSSTVWAAAVLWSLTAMMLPGGLTSPAVGLTLMFALGVLPRMTGWRGRRRGAWRLVLALGGMLVLLDVVGDPGLSLRMALLGRLSDKTMHGVTGFVLAMTLAWWLGSKRWWGGLGVLVIGVLAGAAGEIVQKHFTTRHAEILDFRAHTIGVAIALGVYAVCLLGRWAEPPDANDRPWRRRPETELLGWSVRVGLAGLWGLGMLGWTAKASLGLLKQWIDPPIRYVATDLPAVVPLRRPLYVEGVVNSPRILYMRMLFNVNPAGQLEIPWATQKHDRPGVYAKCSVLPPGPHAVYTVGRPFGPLAYLRDDLLCVGVEPPGTILAIDVRDYLREPSRMDSLAANPMNGVTPIFLYVNRLEDYPAIRRKLRRRHPDVPIVSSFIRKDNPWPLLYRLRHYLRDPDNQLLPIVVLTSDKTLATKMRRLGAERREPSAVNPSSE